jgi:muramoyltetrapeptide carboxypeptidase
MIRPPALKPGGTIGIMAPSSRVTQDAVAKASNWLENYGFGLKVHPQTFAVHNQSAGSPAEKLAAFHELVEDPSVGAIMAARGGNRSGLMLSGIDYALLARKPKPLIGYSDVTALLNGITRKTGLVTFHGPGLNSFTNGTEEKHLEQAFLILAGMTRELPMWGTAVIRPGAAEGHLVGGNLSLISSLMGTVWEPNFDGAILFLEDAGDQMSRYDRMLIHLHNAGVFDRVKAVVFGDMGIAEDKSAVPFGFTLDEVIDEILHGFRGPIVRNAPFGHGVNQITLPVGMPAILDAQHDRSVSMMLKDKAVQG